MAMLNENQIVDAVCEHLKANGYLIIKKCTTTDQGIDIIAQRAADKGGRLLVEAKGGTSAREGSPDTKRDSADHKFLIA